MIRAILGVIVGYAVWTAIWLGGNSLFFGEASEVVGAGERYAEVMPLLGVILLSVVCSLVAGLVAAWIACTRAQRAAMVLGILLLVTGIGVQMTVWSLMPLWHHLIFLLLVVPVTLAGARLAPGSCRSE